MPTGTGYRRIRYEPSATVDRLSESGQGGLTKVYDTLARRLVSAGLYELYFHANSKLSALENSVDVSARYKLLRLRREWTGTLAPGPDPGPIASGYTLETSASGPRGFGPDYGAKSWVDCPGSRLTGRTSRSYRELQEFVSAIGEANQDRKPVPEFGGLYYVVAADVTPEKYRIWMSLEKPLTPDQMLGAMGVAGKSFPVDVIRPAAPPDFASFRFVPHDWQEYAKFTA